MPARHIAGGSYTYPIPSLVTATFEREAKKLNIETFFPSRALSTDNAAMIAAAGYSNFASGQFSDATLDPVPNLPLV
jgi:N6-L-threonylcarbamoyladenine synthase